MKNLTFLFVLALFFSCSQKQCEETQKKEFPELKKTLSKAELADKIKGGWAGQVIGVTFGGPTEFQFKGCMINDYQPIPWDETRCLWYYENAPGLYDDVYMDLTFVDVFERRVWMLRQNRMPWLLQMPSTNCGMLTRLRVTIS